MPTNQYEGVSTALNDGFISEERRLTDPNNLNSPVIPFARTYRTSALTHVNQSGRDHDYGVYIQDTWRPIPRLTATIGLRTDFVERFDRLRDFAVQNSVEIAPRAGRNLPDHERREERRAGELLTRAQAADGRP